MGLFVYVFGAFCFGPPEGAQGELREAVPPMPFPRRGSAWKERPREARPGPPKGDQKKKGPPFFGVAERSSVSESWK